jgi:hypothetical protein
MDGFNSHFFNLVDEAKWGRVENFNNTRGEDHVCRTNCSISLDIKCDLDKVHLRNCYINSILSQKECLDGLANPHRLPFPFLPIFYSFVFDRH